MYDSQEHKNAQHALISSYTHTYTDGRTDGRTDGHVRFSFRQ